MVGNKFRLVFIPLNQNGEFGMRIKCLALVINLGY